MAENNDAIVKHIGSSASLERFNIAAMIKLASAEEKAQLSEVQTRALAEVNSLPEAQKEAVLFLASIKRELDELQINKNEPGERVLADKAFYIAREIELNRDNLDGLVSDKAKIISFAHENFSELDGVKKADVLHAALVDKHSRDTIFSFHWLRLCQYIRIVL